MAACGHLVSARLAQRVQEGAFLGSTATPRSHETSPRGSVGSRLVILPKSGHMTFVDQQELFNHAVDEFLNASKR